MLTIFASDKGGRAHIARARILAENDQLLLASHDTCPVLSPGPSGAFDESG